LCQLLGVPTPGSAGDYIFEQDTLVLGEARGYADVFKRNHFAWENKAPGKNLDVALKQLLTYSLALSNPPLLVVCDRLTIRIHTQFNGHPSEVHTVLLGELDQPAKQALLRRLWTDPESFRPKKTSRDITEAAAKSFATLADGLRKRDNDPDEVAHFLTQCLFCFFAEDVGLLPERMFEGLVNNKHLTADKLTQGLTNLFSAMCDGGLYGNDDIPWFNGGLFKKVKVPALSIMEVTELRNAAALNWSAIDVSIFGTLFERGLDPAKRSQLGAHYTDPATILRIIEPVLSRPLLQKWEAVAQDIRTLLSKSKKKGDKHYNAGKARFVLWLEDLRNYRLLDPACGSGNFLFMGLKALKDIEHKSHLDAAMFGLDREADLVTGPHNVLGIELNEYAAELARVTVWIGELQWRMAHGYEFKTNPVLESLDHIECRDALLSFTEPGARAGQTPEAHTLRFLKSPPTSAPPTPLDVGSSVDVEKPGSAEPGVAEMGSDPDFAKQNSGSDPTSAGVREATWPKANVVIGNPPFLGQRFQVRELGEHYVKSLRGVYGAHVSGNVDLVCYWFVKALKAMKFDGLEAAGLVTTNSIRGGDNRVVLSQIEKPFSIFNAWSDEPWVNDGAAVRVSLVCFGGNSNQIELDGNNVERINSDLTAVLAGEQSFDLTSAKKLSQSKRAAFSGFQMNGSFNVPYEVAKGWLNRPNPNGKSSSLVLHPYSNASDITKRSRDEWVIDFTGLSEEEASFFEAPFAHVNTFVKPERARKRETYLLKKYWLHKRSSPEMRNSIKALGRFIATPMVSKYRLFAWLPTVRLPENAAIVIARADDTTFGIVHSRFHEVWSLKMCTWMGVGNDPRYTPTTCFETFPFPAGLTPADTAHQQTEQVESGALIPAHLQTPSLEAGVVRMSGAILKSEAYEPPASEPLPPGQGTQSVGQSLNLRTQAIQIANAAKKLSDLRNNWLNPPEWTHKVPEVTPLGMDKSPYPDRIEPKPGISEQDLKALQKRTLTNLYNAKPAWLTMAHQQLDQAVALAYGWPDYTPDMANDEILKRLLALNLVRSAIISGTTHRQTP
ncbi:MAG: hypothetical protein PSV24_03455, partial [Rhodoferax sp.]|nr:hypothetical protein [Rhodoferax sp.]